MTKKKLQTETLTRCISSIKGKGAIDLAKRILLFLVNRSQGLTKEVCLTISEDEYTAKEIHKIVRALSGITHGTSDLNATWMPLTGSGFWFSLHYGHFEAPGVYNTEGQFAGLPGHLHESPDEPFRYTIWLSKDLWATKATVLNVSRKKLEGIRLTFE